MTRGHRSVSKLEGLLCLLASSSLVQVQQTQSPEPTNQQGHPPSVVPLYPRTSLALCQAWGLMVRVTSLRHFGGKKGVIGSRRSTRSCS